MRRRIAIGDIHGCYNTLKKLLEKQIKISKEDHFYFVGDFIDRGPASREVLDYLIDLKWRGFKIVSVMGNHEDMMLRAFFNEAYMHAWYNNGAEYTLRSFQVPEEVIFDYEGIRQIPEPYIQYISSLPLYHEEEDFVLCHAGINFNATKPFEDTESMLWIRDFTYQSGVLDNRRLIHGHTPMPVVSIERNLRNNNAKVINLDAGCVYKDLPGYGYLLALDLDTGEHFIQENIDDQD